ARHQTVSGFQVGVTRTIAMSLGDLYAWTANADKRRRWFPRKRFTPSSQTRNKYLRGAWGGGPARLEIGFYAKGAGKAQIAAQVSKLAREQDVDSERAAW